MKVEVVRSPRRRKTITAERRGNRLVVRLPAGLSRSEERSWVERMVADVERRDLETRLNAGRSLERAAHRLNKRFFHGRLSWEAIRYVTNQRDRFGSCTPSNGTIRISGRVATMPAFVRDYVVVHELAHLSVGDHSPRFWRLVNRYPMAERAQGYLMAIGMEE
jgi:predicted metal-dependent hydrolase